MLQPATSPFGALATLVLLVLAGIAAAQALGLLGGLSTFEVGLWSCIAAALVLEIRLNPDRDVRGFLAGFFIRRITIILFLGLSAIAYVVVNRGVAAIANQ